MSLLPVADLKGFVDVSSQFNFENRNRIWRAALPDMPSYSRKRTVGDELVVKKQHKMICTLHLLHVLSLARLKI